MTTDIAPLDAEPAAEPEAVSARSQRPGQPAAGSASTCGPPSPPSASVEVTQGFRNPFDVPLEATYIFPLPDRAAVTAMRMEAAGMSWKGC